MGENNIINKIKRFKIISFFFRLISPGFSHCEKCGLPWNHCKEKTIYYNHFAGTFSTYQYCWDHSSLDELKKCYTKTYNNQLYRPYYKYEYPKYKHPTTPGINKMDHTLKELLDAVEKNFNEEKIQRRKQKINSLKKRTKKNRLMNVTLFRKDKKISTMGESI